MAPAGIRLGQKVGDGLFLGLANVSHCLLEMGRLAAALRNGSVAEAKSCETPKVSCFLLVSLESKVVSTSRSNREPAIGTVVFLVGF